MKPARSLVIAAMLALAAAPAATLAQEASTATAEAAAPAPVDEGVRLLMIDRAGCIYCAQWKEEVMPEYALTPEGRAAPLAIVDIDGPFPDGLALDRTPVLTPTFVLLRDGQELGRLEGYAGELFFWSLLGRLLTQNGIEFPPPEG